MTRKMHQYLTTQISSLEQEEHLIAQERKDQLAYLAEVIKGQLQSTGKAEVIFVCTHNSRRSQLAELWLGAATSYYDFDGVLAFSGGTEAAAFNPRMVDAVVRFGFFIEKSPAESNPKYQARLGKSDKTEATMFSKKYDDPFNPQQDFIAVMVCSEADRNCPFVPGAVARISLPYEDPKAADGTPRESAVYDAKVREIGREMLYLGRLLSLKV